MKTLLQACVLGLVVYVCCGFVVPDSANQDDNVESPKSDTLERVLLSPKEAKVFHRVRRWAGFKTITGEEEEEEEEGSREQRARDNLRRQCQAQCWGAWSAWGSCSVQCGTSGVKRQTRSRSVSSQCRSIINTHGCPGSSVRTASCTQQCQHGGTLGRTSCNCPAGWRNNCCQTRVTCGFPGKPSNGQVSSGASSHVYGTRVTYSCDAGYTRQGAADNMCQNNGQWRSTVPTCRRVTCSQPSLNTHVSISPSRTSYDYGSSVVFSCPEGYTRRGASTARCGGIGSWNRNSPTCRAITCPAAAAPSNGAVSTSNGVSYRSVATFRCNSGYHLSGSTRRTCQISGQWDGTQPTCTRVTCSRLSAPTNGQINQPSNPVQGNAATYSCNSGYELRGNLRRTCNYGGSSATGSWSGSTPSCSAVSCGQPSTPAHGTRTGNTFTYGSRVSFRCGPGYYLQGAETVTCQANKAWSASSPSCVACAVNTYKIGSNAERSCTSCAAHSHTVSAGSSQRTQCVCDQGYEGSNGGPCSIIKCPAITPPTNGLVGACSLNYQDTCSVSCADGYVRHGGDETRTCLLNKRWSGVAPTCRACPKNTYKSGSSECSNCPINSQTAGEASSRTDCRCKTGFTGTPGQTCTDVNECSANNGGCEQVCTDFPGMYKCECNTGFVKDSTNGKKCVAKNSCPALETPQYGGLVCVAEKRVSTERCSVKCNHGYQHIIRPNQFEECGPSTNFRWTTEANMTPILGCMESFFDEIYIDGEAAYFTTSCDQVTGSVLQDVQTAFIAMLRSKGVCMDLQGQPSCSIDDVTVSCGEQDRRKRGTNASSELKIRFKLKVPSTSKLETSCKTECEATAAVVLFDECYAKCESRVEAERYSVLQDATRALGTDVVDTRGDSSETVDDDDDGRRGRPQGAKPSISTEFGAAGLLLRPAGDVTFGQIESTCERGMENRNGTCIPCSPGSYLNSSQSRCVLCPPNHYTNASRQTRCIQCAQGFHSPRGATSCTQSPTEEPIDFFVVIKPREE